MKFNLKDLLDKKISNITHKHIIYRIYNLVNLKSYIGEIKPTSELYVRFLMEHQMFYGSHESNIYDNLRNDHLYNSINKYGPDKFGVEILHLSDSYTENLEETFIEKYDSFYNGYNNSIDGKSYGYNSKTTKGKIWITNPNHEDTLIKEVDLEYWISRGFKRGRRPNSGGWANEGVHYTKGKIAVRLVNDLNKVIFISPEEFDELIHLKGFGGLRNNHKTRIKNRIIKIIELIKINHEGISELNFNKYKYRSRIKYSEAILNYPELFND
jgi:hypothetical protein